VKLRRRKKSWRLYSRRLPDGTYRIEQLGGGEERKLPRGALVSADGFWAEVYDEKGLVEVLIASGSG
jgi:hypothetical protein